MSEKTKYAFIIGTGRCGSTWLSQMLNSNPELCVPPEIQLLFEYSGNGNRLYEEFLLAGQQGLTGDQLSAVIERGCPYNLDQFFDYRTFCRQDITPKRTLRTFVSAFYSAIAEHHHKRWFIEQTPWYGQRLDLMAALFPDAKFIHVVRDGRDVALSFARTEWWHKSARLNLSRWQKEVKKIALDAKFLLKPNTYLEIKYEDLVADTPAALKIICLFLGVDFDPGMLNPQTFIDYDTFCKIDISQVSSQAYSAWRKQKDKVVFSDNVQAWRKNDGVFNKRLPVQISDWLSYYGYPVEATDTQETEVTHLREYSLNALEQENLEQACHIQNLEQSVADSAERLEKIKVLKQALSKQTEHAVIVIDEWHARGELIDQLSEKYQVLERLCSEQEGMVSELGQTINDLRREIVSLTEQMLELEQALQAREALLKQVGETNLALTKESADRGEHIIVLERFLAEQVRQFEGTTVHLVSREQLIQELTASVEALTALGARQTKRIEQLMFDSVVSANTNSKLIQDITDRELLIESLEGRLNEFERSWYGMLRKSLSK